MEVGKGLCVCVCVCACREKQAKTFQLDPGLSRSPVGHRCRLGPFRRGTYFSLLSKKVFEKKT